MSYRNDSCGSTADLKSHIVACRKSGEIETEIDRLGRELDLLQQVAVELVADIADVLVPQMPSPAHEGEDTEPRTLIGQRIRASTAQVERIMALLSDAKARVEV